KELDKNNAGKAIVYTVDEVEVPEGYTKSLSGDAETGYTITNTHNNDLTEVSVEKIWDDAKDQDGIRPESITVQLFANGEPVDGSQVTLDGSTD
ncbi:Cna B-type domain-containing protein, partial [Algoriphagus aestuarii]|nr:Cna B-type domain-containing protein [Algoriphagus aestuarii]